MKEHRIATKNNLELSLRRTDRRTEIQTDRRTNRRTDGHTDRQKDRQTGKQRLKHYTNNNTGLEEATPMITVETYRAKVVIRNNESHNE